MAKERLWIRRRHCDARRTAARMAAVPDRRTDPCSHSTQAELRIVGEHVCVYVRPTGETNDDGTPTHTYYAGLRLGYKSFPEGFGAINSWEEWRNSDWRRSSGAVPKNLVLEPLDKTQEWTTAVDAGILRPHLGPFP